MKTLLCLIFSLLAVAIIGNTSLYAQGFSRKTYHDSDKTKLKEVYQVKDTIRNVLQGKYISYHLNGNLESTGQFTNNETSGVWEFYYESGNLKMRGILLKGSNDGFWEYFYESGVKSMEGNIYGRNKEGLWKMYYETGQLKEAGEYKNNKRHGSWKSYFEDGTLKGSIDYEDDHGRYFEYNHTGKIIAEGPKRGSRQVGLWRFYGEDGTLRSEGEYVDGKRHGPWKEYFSSGKVSAQGNYDNGEPTGSWNYYFENGSVSTTGNYIGGQKNGYWQTFTDNGILMSEITYANGSGEYREYHKSGKLKVKGMIVNGKKHGKWEFYFEGGQLEGVCEFTEGKGTYYGYYPNGALQTKGNIDNNRKIGRWDIYDMDGQVSGYYKPYYDQAKLGNDIISFEAQPKVSAREVKRFTYFTPRANEFRGVIMGGNPMLSFAGWLPFGVEYYSQERLGHEFEFVGIRDPFFQKDENIPKDKLYRRGYSVALKQKFYNPLRTGMAYFGHEVRFTNLGHFANVLLPGSPENEVTVSGFEQRIEYGLLLGYRFMQRNNSRGLTLDAFISGDVGARYTDIREEYKPYFEDINQSAVVTSFHIGLNIGYIFSNR